MERPSGDNPFADFGALRRALETEYAGRPFEDAVGLLSAYLRDKPSDGGALRLRAYYHGLLQDWAGVAADLEEVRRGEPDAVLGPRLAYAYGALGRWEESEAEYSRELALAPADGVLLEGRAKARTGRGDHAGALSDLRAAAASAPQDDGVLAALAGAEVRVGLVEKALEHMDAAVALSPGFWPHLFDRGILHARLERWAQAEADLDRAVAAVEGKDALAGELATALTYRGLARMAQGRRADALADMEKAVAADPARAADLAEGIKLARGDGS